MLVIDETGFLKQGKPSCGVGRHYTCPAEKIMNRHLGMFAAHVLRHDHVFIELAVYLLKIWRRDRERSTPPCWRNCAVLLGRRRWRLWRWAHVAALQASACVPVVPETRSFAAEGTWVLGPLQPFGPSRVVFTCKVYSLDKRRPEMTDNYHPITSQDLNPRGTLPGSKVRPVLLVSLMGAAGLLLPILAAQAQTAPPPPQPSVAPQVSSMPTTPPPSPQMLAKAKHDAMLRDKRIAAMHKRLDLTPAQENLWAPVAKAMSKNSAAFDAVVMKIPDTKMTAVDRLKSFEAMADAHAAGLHRLIPPFSALYASMSDNQKQHADQMFDHGQRKHRDAR